MTISYETIFADFLGNITDYQLASLNMSDAYEQMTEWLHKALAKSYLRHVFTTISLDDSIQILTYELETTVDDDADKEFVMDVIAKGMTVEWLTPQVRSRLNTNQAFMGKEQKFFSQAAHLEQLRALLTDTELSLRKMLRDRSYIYNSYLED